ncbi:MAG: hypothetical protein EP349_07785 [Alphaproteobacteria bacterium]|nr:MAG: hypothetical protein EP349_07785 [Alphaproteobacteria bacterium]
MELHITKIVTEKSKWENRSTCSVEGTIDGEEISFEYEDSGPENAYDAELSYFYYEGGDADDDDIIEEALKDWIGDDERKVMSLQVGNIITLEPEKTQAYQKAPRNMSDATLVNKLRGEAEAYLEFWADSDAYRMSSYFNGREREITKILDEAQKRLDKDGADSHRQLKDVADFLDNCPKNTWTEYHAARQLAALPEQKETTAKAPANDDKAHQAQQGALRNYIKNRKPPGRPSP